MEEGENEKEGQGKKRGEAIILKGVTSEYGKQRENGLHFVSLGRR